MANNKICCGCVTARSCHHTPQTRLQGSQTVVFENHGQEKCIAHAWVVCRHHPKGADSPISRPPWAHVKAIMSWARGVLNGPMRIASYNPKVQLKYITATEVCKKSRVGELSILTERCNSIRKGMVFKSLISGSSSVGIKPDTRSHAQAPWSHSTPSGARRFCRKFSLESF